MCQQSVHYSYAVFSINPKRKVCCSAPKEHVSWQSPDWVYGRKVRTRSLSSLDLVPTRVKIMVRRGVVMTWPYYHHRHHSIYRDTLESHILAVFIKVYHIFTWTEFALSRFFLLSLREHTKKLIELSFFLDYFHSVSFVSVSRSSDFINKLAQVTFVSI